METETYVDTWVHYHDGGVPGRRPVLKGIDAKETFNELPKIDFQRIYSDDLEDRKELAREVGAACRDTLHYRQTSRWRLTIKRPRSLEVTKLFSKESLIQVHEEVTSLVALSKTARLSNNSI